MAVCKDCLYWKVCNEYRGAFWGHKAQYSSPIINASADSCIFYKDRSRFVELPCRVSGDCFFINQNGTIQRATLERVYMFSTSTELFLNDGREIYSTSLNESNIELFPTYKEAERALKEREKND